jgi:hypothetical protein
VSSQSSNPGFFGLLRETPWFAKSFFIQIATFFGKYCDEGFLIQVVEGEALTFAAIPLERFGNAR